MSFATPDSEFANELKEQLEGTELFRVIPFEQSQQWHSGVKWDVTHLHRLVNDADAFLALHTEHIMREEFLSWLRHEYGLAVFRAKTPHEKPCSLVRAIVDDPVSELPDMPIEFVDFQTVDYRDPHSHELSLDRLVQALLVGHPPLSDQARKRYVFREALEPNPRREMFKRVFENEFDRAFTVHVGPLEDKVQRLADLQRAQDNLMTPEIISIEEGNAFDDIWVVSHSLHNDLFDTKIPAIIKKNLEKGIDYTYFVPRTPLIKKRRKRFRGMFADYCEGDNAEVDDAGNAPPEAEPGRVRFIWLDAGVFMPFDELVVYDGESATNRWGYIQMSYERSKESNTDSGLVMKIPDRTLSTIIEFLIELKRADEETRKKGLSGEP